MNLQSWTFDAQSGTFKDNALSKEVLSASIAQTIFMREVQPVSGYGRNKGESVSIPRFSNIAIPSEGRVGEFDDLPEDLVAQSSKKVTVSEWGRSLPYSNFNAKLSPLDLPMHLREKLQQNMSLILDKASADAFKTTLTKYVPTGAAAGTFYTNGTPGAPAGSNLNFFHVEKLVDYLDADLHAEKYEDGNYRLITCTKGYRGLKLDPKFETWNAPQHASAKRRGVVGDIEGMTIIKTNNQGTSGSGRALRSDLGTGSVLGETLAFGKRPVCMAEVSSPQLMVYRNSFDGRRFAIAWTAILEFAAKWAADSASDGEGDIIHVSSS
jgi:hypothetical protein